MTSSPTDDLPQMPISPTRSTHLQSTLSHILTRISSVSTSLPPRLVAVSKLKPISDILALHSPPHHHLHFGENYLQELLQKASLLPRSIRWHFIGALQTNKCRPLAEQVPNLWAVESVDTRKKAEGLDKGRRACWERMEKEEGGKGEREQLRCFVQVNTSGEESKSGVSSAQEEEVLALCRFIASEEECPHLKLQGLMTIGAIARSKGAAEEGKENEDFVVLREVRDMVAREMGIEKGELELSMGMSEDFESAIRCGSDEVRVGSTIFGERPSKQDAKVKDDVDEGKG
ncbi:MAG: hypothetical protein Q9220_001126 [cf. Caloplaca sp. 1 TL-2023]